MKKQLLELNLKLSALTVFRDLLSDPVIRRFQVLAEALEEKDLQKQVSAYSVFQNQISFPLIAKELIQSLSVRVLDGCDPLILQVKGKILGINTVASGRKFCDAIFVIIVKVKYRIFPVRQKSFVADCRFYALRGDGRKSLKGVQL